MQPSPHRSMLLLALLLTGCAQGTAVNISEPYLPDSTGEGASRISDGILRAGDLSISIKPQNPEIAFVTAGPLIPVVPVGPIGQGSQPQKGKPFQVVVQLETSSAGYTFMAGDVSLFNGDTEYRPSESDGPLRYATVPTYLQRASRGHDWVCDEVPRLRPGLLLSDIPVPMSRSCFVLQFPIYTLSPDQRFQLKLRGFKRDGRAIELPNIEFRRGTNTVYTIIGRRQSSNRLYTDARKSSARG